MERLQRILNLRVIIVAIAAAGCLFTIMLGLLLGARNEQPATASGTAVLYVIAAPSATPLIPLATVTPTATSTTQIPQTTTDGILTIGAYVQIGGTGGDGLRLRSDPGLSGTVRFLAIDGEIFQVLDGPREADGYSWWHLQAPYDSNVEGWAVDEFFTVVQNP